MSRKISFLFSGTLIVSLLFIFFACQKEKTAEKQVTNELEIVAGKPASSSTLGTPTISCVGGNTGASINILFTAGSGGASAGFSIQWMLKSDFDNAGGWPVNSDNPGDGYGSFCKASFSGVPGNCSNAFTISAAGGQKTVNIGENLFDLCGASTNCLQELLCGTAYVFRAFSHNVPGAGGLNKSGWSNTLTCNTAACSIVTDGCTYTQGYWKNHGPAGCVSGNNTNAWPVTELTLGLVTYTDIQLCNILNTPAVGNGLISMAHQLIAAKLNIANGADGTDIFGSIAAADALIGSLVIPPTGSGSLAASITSALNTALTNYNEGLTGPGHCR